MERANNCCSFLDYRCHPWSNRASNFEASLKMIQITKYCDQKVGILGFGATGVSAAESLSKGGANVLIWDDHWKRRCFAVRSGFRVIDFSLEGLDGLDLLQWLLQ